MTVLSAEFGYYPRLLDFTAGPVTVAALPDLAQTVLDVEASETVDSDWIYSGAQLVSNWGKVSERPFSARVFGLPMTHRIDHNSADGLDHLAFHVWALSFFLGIRLTTTEAGFLDATPIKAGKLVDFVLLGKIENAVAVAEAFWTGNRATPANAKRWVAAIHALFLAQNPQSLQFERFIYLYTAIEAACKIRETQAKPKKSVRHFEKIGWMCQQLGMSTPDWADHLATGSAEVADLRNPLLHEALFMNEPLGFAIHGVGSNGNLTLEMKALACRFLAAIIGVTDTSYIRSAINTRQRQGLRL